jgi:hypothetical protein
MAKPDSLPPALQALVNEVADKVLYERPATARFGKRAGRCPIRPNWRSVPRPSSEPFIALVVSVWRSVPRGRKPGRPCRCLSSSEVARSPKRGRGGVSCRCQIYQPERGLAAAKARRPPSFWRCHVAAFSWRWPPFSLAGSIVGAVAGILLGAGPGCEVGELLHIDRLFGRVPACETVAVMAVFGMLSALMPALRAARLDLAKGLGERGVMG